MTTTTTRRPYSRSCILLQYVTRMVFQQFPQKTITDHASWAGTRSFSVTGAARLRPCCTCGDCIAHPVEILLPLDVCRLQMGYQTYVRCNRGRTCKIGLAAADRREPRHVKIVYLVYRVTSESLCNWFSGQVLFNILTECGSSQIFHCCSCAPAYMFVMFVHERLNL